MRKKDGTKKNFTANENAKLKPIRKSELNKIERTSKWTKESFG